MINTSSKTAQNRSKPFKTTRFPDIFFKWAFATPGHQKLSIVWSLPGPNGRTVCSKPAQKPLKTVEKLPDSPTFSLNGRLLRRGIRNYR
jgi:hypothetical protein